MPHRESALHFTHHNIQYVSSGTNILEVVGLRQKVPAKQGMPELVNVCFVFVSGLVLSHRKSMGQNLTSHHAKFSDTYTCD